MRKVEHSWGAVCHDHHRTKNPVTGAVFRPWQTLLCSHLFPLSSLLVWRAASKRLLRKGQEESLQQPHREQKHMNRYLRGLLLLMTFLPASPILPATRNSAEENAHWLSPKLTCCTSLSCISCGSCHWYLDDQLDIDPPPIWERTIMFPESSSSFHVAENYAPRPKPKKTGWVTVQLGYGERQALNILIVPTLLHPKWKLWHILVDHRASKICISQIADFRKSDVWFVLLSSIKRERIFQDLWKKVLGPSGTGTQLQAVSRQWCA